MRLVPVLLIATLFFAAGCGEAPKTTAKAPTKRSNTTRAGGGDAVVKDSAKKPADTDDAGTPEPAPDAGSAKGTAVSDSGEVALSPENTKVEFVGLHTNKEKPDPRKGTFEKFSGKLQVDKEAKALKSISVEFDTTSIKTEIQKLTDHLKTADFFEVQEYPTAKFESTKIEPGEGTALVTGSLTLHGVTKEISFPATVEVQDDSVSLRSTFTIDRTEFNMNFRPEQVEKEVSLTVTVGG